MNEAIGLFNKIDGQPQKARLDIFQEILDKVSSIVNEFPASDETRVILSKQSIGNFNPENLKNDYIAELTDYYNNICQVSPSYTCLAYISLNNGNNLCQNAKTFLDIDKAYQQLSNALEVFTSQDSGDGMAKLVVTTARQCIADLDLSDWNTDYYTSWLVNMLLDVDLDDNAKALIQDMNSPFFKFRGVLSLKVKSGVRADEKYLSRLESFIEDTIGKDIVGNKSPANVPAFLATAELTMFAIDHSDMDIDYGYTYSLFKYKAYSMQDSSCKETYANFVFNLMLDYQIKLVSIPESRNKISAQQLSILLNETGSRYTNQYSRCKKINEKYAYYSLALKIHGIILNEIGVSAASEFRTLIRQRELNAEEMFVELFERTSISEEALIDTYFEDNKYVSPSISKYLDRNRASLEEKFPIPTFAQMPIFKRLVDFGNVCESSLLLFQEIAKGDRFEEAVKYMLESPSIDGSIKHSCGDEDLELLLG